MESTALQDSQRLEQRMREGDQEALALYFHQQRQHLRRMIAFRIDPRLLGRVDASDVVQEVYLDALQRLPHLATKPDLPALAWLRMVAGQRLVDVHRMHLGVARRDAGREFGGTPAGMDTSLCMAERFAGNVTSPSGAAARAERLQRLTEALETMDPVDREVLALRHFEELSNDEVAAVLGLQKSAASNRYVRALKRLREILLAAGGFEASLG